MPADISYRVYDDMVSFFPNTPDGEYVWKEMFSQAGTCKFPKTFLNDIKKQIRDAGYSVFYQPNTDQSVDEILEELND